MSHVVVTGAAGFIGSHLVEALVARGDEVVGVDNFDPFYPRPMKERNLAALRGSPRFALHEVDILDAGRLAAVLTPESILVHLAAKAGVRPSLEDPLAYARTNLAGTAAVLEAARRAGVSRIVFASSSSVYGDDTPSPFREDAPALAPVSPYGATKRGGELLLAAMAPLFGFRAAALRFFTVYGPRQRPDLAIHAFARRMAEGKPITLFGDGSNARDYTYCDDIVRGVVAAMDWTATAAVGMEIFNLGGSRPVALRDMVAEIARALGVEPRIEWAPLQPGDVRHTAADLTKSGRVLGYRPTTPFADGIRRFVAWFREVHERHA
ncbi:MAG TPA: NAD-dependent epimerase/dehydratase family protein [Gemmatimonadales bacterium]|nr:NAD-dependent epimerase/dehydratase family protein [Gemmatimonadales bacterium]